jgi:hypothetical protein
MSEQKFPYLDQCRFCGQGLLRFWQCGTCGAWLVMCDECELVWADVPTVAGDPTGPADAAYPYCPVCGGVGEQWILANDAAVQAGGWGPYVRGWST